MTASLKWPWQYCRSAHTHAHTHTHTHTHTHARMHTHTHTAGGIQLRKLFIVYPFSFLSLGILSYACNDGYRIGRADTTKPLQSHCLTYPRLSKRDTLIALVFNKKVWLSESVIPPRPEEEDGDGCWHWSYLCREHLRSVFYSWGNIVYEARNNRKQKRITQF